MTRPRPKLPPRGAAVAIIRRLVEHGHAAYLAGGCVRDQLLGVEPQDFDIATDARPERVQELFTRTAAVGASFGVILVRDFGPTVEVATFRTDGPYSDQRRPDTVEYANEIADAHRRDFTINALFLDPLAEPEPRVIDHVGGLADVAARVLRAVGDPEKRLAEDHLRALRAVRFAARYGLTIDERTQRAVSAHAGDLAGVSRERIGDEIRRMMAHATRAHAASLVQSLGLDAPIFGAPAAGGELTMLRGVETSDHLLGLCAWAIDRNGGTLPDPAATASAWRTALMLTNEDSSDLRGTLDTLRRLDTEWDKLGVAQQKRLATRRWARGALALLEVFHVEHARAVRARIASLAATPSGLSPVPLIDGDALIGAGFAPGPVFGVILETVYDAQLEDRIATRAESLQLARSIADTQGSMNA